ncbi:MAG TPA: TIGR02757 family protein [Thermoanaerobaculia bacterium]|nr:TIGR02757 family protein [Thermoanaerobaculia bacterium]
MPRHRRPVRGEALKSRLDALVETFDVTTIAPDPLQLVLRFDDPLDQEVAGLIAAAFAYGRAETIVANLGAVLAKMRPSPYRYLAAFDPAEARKRFAGFAHRFHKTPELVAFLGCLAAVIESHGSLGALFRECYEPADADIGPTLARFVEVVRGGDRTNRTNRTDRTNREKVPPLPIRPIGPIRPIRPIGQRALQYLLTSPNDGSACKRMNLYLRWMVRRTSPDLGLWTFVDPAKLVMPVDTHIHRIATFLGLNERRSADWKAARALTDKLAKFDRGDPVRYDFALCRLGILDLCSRKRRRENCDVCMLREVCRFPVTS